MVRYQADADLKRVILLAVVRQEPTVDFRSAAEAGLVALPDKEVLAAAAEAGRVLILATSGMVLSAPTVTRVQPTRWRRLRANFSPRRRAIPAPIAARVPAKRPISGMLSGRCERRVSAFDSFLRT
jgi:hypothetical protein